MDVVAAKQGLRRRFGAEDAPAPAAAAAAGERVRSLLLADAVFAQAERIGLYSALRDEIPIASLFEALVRSGRCCGFPRTLASGVLRFARVERLEDLRPGRYGVAEPVVGPDAEAFAAEIVIVPGISFDRMGHRLGRGAGCYDRTFPPEGSDQPRLIGVAYAARIVPSLPYDSHDRAMDAIVTERELWWTRGIR